MIQKNVFLQYGNKNAKLDADFESIEKVEKITYEKVIIKTCMFLTFTHVH
jgi:hypothetical protein